MCFLMKKFCMNFRKLCKTLCFCFKLVVNINQFPSSILICSLCWPVLYSFHPYISLLYRFTMTSVVCLHSSLYFHTVLVGVYCPQTVHFCRIKILFGKFFLLIVVLRTFEVIKCKNCRTTSIQFKFKSVFTTKQENSTVHHNFFYFSCNHSFNFKHLFLFYIFQCWTLL